MVRSRTFTGVFGCSWIRAAPLPSGRPDACEKCGHGGTHPQGSGRAEQAPGGGRYEVLGAVAAGRTSMVFAARDLEAAAESPTGEAPIVAVKRAHANFVGEAAVVDGIVREAELGM